MLRPSPSSLRDISENGESLFGSGSSFCLCSDLQRHNLTVLLKESITRPCGGFVLPASYLIRPFLFLTSLSRISAVVRSELWICCNALACSDSHGLLDLDLQLQLSGLHLWHCVAFSSLLISSSSNIPTQK